MATATSSLPSMAYRPDPSTAQPEFHATAAGDAKLPSAPSFVTFEDKKATVFVNACHIVRFENYLVTGRAHLQLSDGHHYYLSGAMVNRVIDQLKQCQSS
jgi:hypothetical protein